MVGWRIKSGLGGWVDREFWVKLQHRGGGVFGGCSAFARHQCVRHDTVLEQGKPGTGQQY